MSEVELKIINPAAFLENHAAQRQLAAWLVQFGIKNGTIKNPNERGCSDAQKEKKVLHLRRGFDAEKLCAGL